MMMDVLLEMNKSEVLFKDGSDSWRVCRQSYDDGSNRCLVYVCHTVCAKKKELNVHAWDIRDSEAICFYCRGCVPDGIQALMIMYLNGV